MVKIEGPQVLAVYVLIVISLLTFASAEINTYGATARGTCVTTRQTCASCTYVNVSIFFPSSLNSSLAISNAGMANEGGGAWTYLFCNTTVQGRYDVVGSGDLEGTPTGFDVLFFEINEYGISANLFALYTVFYLLLLFASYLFIYKYATYNGGKVRDYNFFFWAAFLDIILYVVIEINGFGGAETLIVDIIKMAALGSGLYFLTQGIIYATSFTKKNY